MRAVLASGRADGDNRAAGRAGQGGDLAGAAARQVAGFLLSGGSSPAQAYTTTLHPVAAAAVAPSGQTVETQTSNGWSVHLTVAHLPTLTSGQVFECWWSGPGNKPSSAGTFTVGGSGSASIQMQTANPDDYPTVQITVVNAGLANQLGRVVLTGTVSDDD